MSSSQRTREARAGSRQEEKQQRASLLDLIAAKRKGSAGAPAILGLESSSEDEAEPAGLTRRPQLARPAQQQRVVLLDDSSDDEGENRGSNSGSGGSGSREAAAPPPTAKPLGRLVKRADLDAAPPPPRQMGDSGSVSVSNAGNDLAAALGGLSINHSGGDSGAAGAAGPAAAPKPKPPAFQPGRLPAVHVSRQPQQQAAAEGDSGAEVAQEGESLTLGEQGQFRLRCTASARSRACSKSAPAHLAQVPAAPCTPLVSDNQSFRSLHMPSPPLAVPSSPPSSTPTRWRASGGCGGCRSLAMAGFWPTTWAWARSAGLCLPQEPAAVLLVLCRIVNNRRSLACAG